MAPKPSITGFDPKRMAAAASGLPGVKDPWARYEAWRYTGPFSRWNRFKGAFPGLGIGSAAFAVYLVYDAFLGKDEHGKDHHTQAM